MRILVADDHPLVRDGLCLLLKTAYPESEITEASSFSDAISVLQADRHMDLMLIDLTMGDLPAGAGLRAVIRSAPLTPTVVISARNDTEAYKTAYNAGGAAFIEKAYAHDRVLEIVERVLTGERVFPAAIMGSDDVDEAVSKAEPSIEALTPRQQQVLAFVGQGLSNKEIANRIGITPGTVKVYLNAIFRAFGVNNRTQAALIAKQQLAKDLPSV